MFKIIAPVSGPINGAKLITREIINTKNDEIGEIIDLSQAKDFGDFGKFTLKKVIHAFRILRCVSKIESRNFVYIVFTPQGYVFYRDLLILFILFMKKCNITCHLHTNMFTKKPGFLLSFIVRNTKIICINSFQRDFLSKYGRVFYLKNALPLGKINWQKQVKTRIERKTLTFLSNIDEKKGFNNLKLLSEYVFNRFHGNVKISVIGGLLDNTLEPELNKLCEKGWINYHGAITNEKEKSSHLKQTFLFLFLSEDFYEAFPLAYIEALNHGLPIITTQQFCTGEVIRENGIILKDKRMSEIGDFINKCLDDEEFYYALCQNSVSNFITNFSFDQYSKELTRIVYES